MRRTVSRIARRVISGSRRPKSRCFKRLAGYQFATDARAEEERDLSSRELRRNRGCYNAETRVSPKRYAKFKSVAREAFLLSFAADARDPRDDGDSGRSARELAGIIAYPG